MLGGKGFRIGQLFRLLEVFVIDIANGGHASVRYPRQRLHQMLTAAARPDKADGQLFIRPKDIDCRDAKSRQPRGRCRRSFQERTPGFFLVGSHGEIPSSNKFAGSQLRGSLAGSSLYDGWTTRSYQETDTMDR